MPKFLIAAMLLFLIPAANNAAVAQQDFVPPYGVDILTEEEIRANIIGNTISGYGADAVQWIEFYRPDGKIRGIEEKWLYKGKWTVSGPVMCFDYKGSTDDECNTIALDGDKVRFFMKDGRPSRYPTGTVLQGNPKKL